MSKSETAQSDNNAYHVLCEDTFNTMAADLKARGETFLPGNPAFDAVVAQIKKNREDRAAYQATMGSPILNWGA